MFPRVPAGLVAFVLILSACAGGLAGSEDTALNPGSLGAETDQFGEPLSPATSTGQPVGGPSGQTPSSGLAPAAPTGTTTQPTAGANSATSEAYAGEVGVTSDQVLVGLFVGKTGAFAGLQTNAEHGMQMAFNEANEAGGVHGRELVARSYDDGSVNPSVIDANWRVAKNEVIAIFGQEGTAFMPHADRDRVPLLYATGLMAAGLASRYGFPAFPYVEYQSRDLMPEYMLNRLDARGKRIAVMFDSFPANSSARTMFSKRAKALGLNVVIEQPVENVPATCTNQVSNVQAQEPDIVFLLVQTPGAICVLRDARSLGFNPEWTSVATVFNTDLIHPASGGSTEGMVVFGHVRTTETACGEAFRAAAAKYYPDRPAMREDAIAYVFYLIGRRFVEHLKVAGRNLTREGFVHGAEQSSGLNDGCISPPTYGPNDRRGALGVSLMKAQDRKWITLEPRWRRSF